MGCGATKLSTVENKAEQSINLQCSRIIVLLIRSIGCVEHIPQAINSEAEKIQEKISKGKKEQTTVKKTEQTPPKENINV